ncbi:MAG: hypothetical protein IBJ03_10895 [Gemmatimonadaceae bacterium]|nr:hypothetical protein [Gemmatimonadaceae bacterium]
MGRTASRPATDAMVRRIEQVLTTQQFLALPEIRMGEEPYCRIIATDAPTIAVTLYHASSIRARSYYTGCGIAARTDTAARSLIQRMQVIADSIEAAAAPDWIRPATRR